MTGWPNIFNRRNRRRFANTLFVATCTLATILALIVLAAILFSLLRNGFGSLNLAVFTQDTPPPGGVGGLRNAILGSILLCVGAMIVAVALGILAGTWLAEYSRENWYAKTVRFVNDVLLSAPSILVGLFVYEIAVRPLHSFSTFAGAIALALIAAPIITRTTEDVLRLQPRTLREAGIGLGTPVWVTIRRILWKSAAGGILTGALLAFARISGETAPLLFTSLNNQFFSLDLLKPIANLPVTIFTFALSAYDDWQHLAWAGALLIAISVLGINTLVRVLSARGRA
ncbi:MAG TPA: phosphate ABC transporter permease PstA [Rhizomicrobium sp.]|jgi:phosphate transport system permease protein|nr:phosphate ABC transporter permease PstA [Rhizomicrobium sp.]